MNRINKFVYLAGPVTGTTEKERYAWRSRAHADLYPLQAIWPTRNGVEVMKMLRENQPFGTRWINQRCWADIRRSDAVLVNLIVSSTGKTDRSIGTLMEMGGAYIMGKIVIVALDDGGIYDHEMVRDSATLVVPTLEEAIYYTRDFLL